MNDTGQPPHSTTRSSAQAIRTNPERPSAAHPIPHEPTADDQGVLLAWRRLDRLASAATLGVVLASPRTALLTVEFLKPRDQPSTTTPRGDGATHRHGVGR